MPVSGGRGAPHPESSAQRFTTPACRSAPRGAYIWGMPAAPVILWFRQDLRLDDIQGPGSLALDGALHVTWGDGQLTLSFTDPEVGIGRHSRSCDCDLHDLRVLVDNSMVELYANGGREAFSTRWFPRTERLDVALDSHCQANAWTMQDCMSNTYEA